MARNEDDRVLGKMLAPNVDEALEALGYWTTAGRDCRSIAGTRNA